MLIVTSIHPVASFQTDLLHHHHLPRRHVPLFFMVDSSSSSSSLSTSFDPSQVNNHHYPNSATCDPEAPSRIVDDENRRRLLLASVMAVSTGTFLSALPPDSVAAAEVICMDSCFDNRHVGRNTLEDRSLDTAISMAPSSSSSTTTTTCSSSGLVVLSSLSVSDAAAAAPAASSASSAAAVDWKAVFEKAGKRALGSGKAGAAASVVQVMSLMWLRTSMNYQYRYGGNLGSSLQTLWKEGGISRLYQGLPFALVQGPLTRFGDTAANVGILALLETIPETRDLPLPLKTACGSISAGLWRILLMPLDASKTSMQVEGADGLGKLWGLVKEEGPAPLYYGALAQASATAAGHWPWFLTYNYVDQTLPMVSSSDDLFLSLVRSAFLGFCASCVSDVVSNSLRVVKTTKQTARLGKAEDDPNDEKPHDETPWKEPSYAEIVAKIIEKDGVGGLLFRGLQTRLLTNSIQGALFSVVWKYLQQTS